MQREGRALEQRAVAPLSLCATRAVGLTPPASAALPCARSMRQAVDLKVSLQQLGTSLGSAASTLTDVQVG